MPGVPISQIPNAPDDLEEPLSGLQAPTFYATGVAQTLLTQSRYVPAPYNPQPLSSLPDYLQAVFSAPRWDTTSSFSEPTDNGAGDAMPGNEPPALSRDPEQPPMVSLEDIPKEPGPDVSPWPELTSPSTNEIDLKKGPIALDINGPNQPDADKAGIIIDPFAEGIDLSGQIPEHLEGAAAIDHDGSPTAYMPGNKGSDDLRNGHAGKNYFGFKPAIKNEEGGYLSQTGWQRGPENTQSSYVDARRVPYVAMPKTYFAGGGAYGDFVQIKNGETGKTIWAVVADSRGRRIKDIEISIAAARQLGVEFNKGGTTRFAKALEIWSYKGSRSKKWY